MGARTADQVLADLAAIRAEMAPIEDKRTELYARRLAVFAEARRLTPPVTQLALADAAGISEVAVINQLKKLRPPT